MNYANKKINQKGNLAQQTAQIISNVAILESKNLIRLDLDTVYLYPEIWKDKMAAINWIKCLHHFYVIKRQFKISAPLYFKHLATDELLGSMINKNPKILIFN